MLIFPTPFHVMWTVIIQTAARPEADAFEMRLAHRIMTYILFITFIIAVPVLFNNFLVRLQILSRTFSLGGRACEI